ncbi:MAG: restriction endonuclease subunit S [Cyanobacteria bacterium MAG CAR3_bin_5]|nr:restriction endonuclease subunit S [Cyanobacteria bacterium MAG CAR3_bin_5]
MKPTSGALRYFCRIKNGATPASVEPEYWDGNIKWATPEDLGKLMSNKIINTKRLITEKAVEECNLSVLLEGAVIISTRAPIGHMAINESLMAFNQGCRGIIPGDQVHGPFLYYMLKSRTCELNAIANGTTFVELSRDELAAVLVEFPPLDTQRRIAQFLDEKTARIDALIEKKHELLDRLAEKRQALITRAVTKGLDSDVPMKPSGVEWIGEIPRHWGTKRLKQISEIFTGYAFRSTDFVDSGIPVLRIGNIQFDGTISLQDAKFLPIYFKERYRNWLVQNGDYAMAMTGATVGKVGRVSNICFALLNQRVCIMRQNKNSTRDFLWLLLNSNPFRKFVELEAFGGAQPNISADKIGLCQIAIPEKSEQAEIILKISRPLAEIDKIEEKIQLSIVHLQEYRSALVTAAVIGQIQELVEQ